MRYLLDTNAVIALLNDNESRLRRRARCHRANEIAISAIVMHELFYGAFKSMHMAQNLDLIDGLPLMVLEFDKEDARHAGQIRAILVKAGTPIGPYDVLIAGQAKARDLVLITHNTKEFSRVSGLKVEDWQIK